MAVPGPPRSPAAFPSDVRSAEHSPQGWLARASGAAVAAALCWAACVALLDGIAWTLPAATLHSRDPVRPLLVAALAAAVHWLALGPATLATRARQVARLLVTRGLFALIAAAAVGYWHFGVTASGGLDSAGYVNAARLIASGRLSEPQPLSRLLPFDRAAEANAPLGFVVGADGESRVPRFPLGLPLMMAAAWEGFGPGAVYRVPQVAALVALLVAYVMARRITEDRASALFATAMLAMSPTLANGAIQPMSDVPAMAWLLAASWLLLVGRTHPVLGGACAGMAVLTRPAVTLAAIALPLVAPGTARARHRALLTVLGFLALHVALGMSLYGSPWTSGYGDTATLFDVGRLGGNLAVFGRWVTATHTLLFWGAWAAALWLGRTRRVAGACSLVAMASAVPYLLYFTWDDWESTRFLLPGLAPVLVVSACAAALLVQRWLPATAAGIAMLAIALVAASSSVSFLRHHQVFTWKQSEARYVLVGDWARTETPPGAVVLAALHSGNVLLYSGRETVRWDVLPPGKLEASVRAIAAQGRHVYLVIDVASENELFYQRFAAELAALELVPAGTRRGVNLFEVRVRTPAGL